ncbi:MAG: LysE family translocator [Crocinitomicaceae bacterium]
MINVLLGGIGLGLVLSLMLGPVFFVLLETSIQKGVRSALYLDLGVFISDILYITIAFLFVNQVSQLMESDYSLYLSIIGGCCFLLFGIYTIRKKVAPLKKQINKSKELATTSQFSTIMKGFFLNAVNPGVLFYWLTIIGTIRKKTIMPGLGENMTVLFYLVIILFTFFTIDIFKILGAEKLKNVLTPAWMNVINKFLGIILMCFGVLFILDGLNDLYHIV